MKYTIITKGTILPDDFIKNSNLNREKYIIEMGFRKNNYWVDEFKSPITTEVIGAIIIGSTFYNDVRYRERNNTDVKWDMYKTTISKILNNIIL